jgi:hypothetical protein
MQAVPLKTFIQFFETPKCQTFRERSVFYWTEKEHRCRNQSGTGRREPSLALKCLGTGLRCWMTECWCRLYHPRCWCSALIPVINNHNGRSSVGQINWRTFLAF